MAAIDSLAERDARRERARGKKHRSQVEAVREPDTGDHADACRPTMTTRGRPGAHHRPADRRPGALAEAAADADRRAGDPPVARWSCTSTPRCSPTTRRPAGPTSRAVRP